MSTIYTREFIAREVAAGRLTDQALQRQGRVITEDAVARVARRTALPTDVIAQIATEEAQAEALTESAARITAVTAASLGITPEIANARACRGCGACACGSAATAYAQFADEDAPC